MFRTTNYKSMFASARPLGFVTAFVLTISISSSSSLRAEVFTLKNGSVITGKWLNADDKSAGEWKVETNDGVVLTLMRADVKGILSPTKEALLYEKNMAKVDDSIATHRKIVDWAIQSGLKLIADAHRERVVELDPEDKSSWAALGYVAASDGWIRKDVFWKRRGMTQKGGRWRIPQDLAVEESETEAKQRKANLDKQIDKSIREAKTNGPRAAQARDFLNELADPMAVPKLRAIMVEDRDKNRDPAFRSQIVTILGRIHSGPAIQTLVDAALRDPDDGVRSESIELLAATPVGRELAVQSFMLKLVNKNPAKDDATIINRAGIALVSLGDERCIERLIECLVTKHDVMVTPPPQGQQQVQMVNDGGINMQQNQKAQLVQLRKENGGVLSALERITNENFAYNTEEWWQWYANTYGSPHPYLLRDP